LSRSADETRSFEVRATENADSAEIGGYAAHFLTVDSHGSTFGRSAFKKTIRERGDKIPVTYNHDPDKLIGQTTELRNDSKGLKFRARIIEDTHWGKEVMTLVRSNVLTGASFRFNSIKDRPGLPTDGIQLDGLRGIQPSEVRFIEEVRLKEIGPVVFPSNPRSQIESYRSEDHEEFFGELVDSIRNADLDADQIERLIASIDAVRTADTRHEEEPPQGTPSSESRHKLDLDIDLLLIEVGKL
jgi:HK97 family phage prohead protease